MIPVILYLLLILNSDSTEPDDYAVYTVVISAAPDFKEIVTDTLYNSQTLQGQYTDMYHIQNNLSGCCLIAAAKLNYPVSYCRIIVFKNEKIFYQSEVHIIYTHKKFQG